MTASPITTDARNAMLIRPASTPKHVQHVKPKFVSTMPPRKEAQASSQKYLHPYSAAISRGKKGNSSSSCEQLLRPSSYVDIPLQSFSACPSPTNHHFPDWHGQPKKPTKRLRAIDDRVLALSVTITLGLLVLIVVPLCAILPPKYVVQLPVNILMPFYVYPNPGTFDRLYSA